MKINKFTSDLKNLVEAFEKDWLRRQFEEGTVNWPTDYDLEGWQDQFLAFVEMSDSEKGDKP